MKRILLLIVLYLPLNLFIAQQISDTSSFNFFISEIEANISHDSSGVEKKLKNAISISYSLKYPKGRADAYQLLGHYTSYWLKDYDQAIDLYLKAQKIYIQVEDVKGQFDVTNRISRNYSLLEDHEKAVGILIDELEKYPDDPYFGCLANNAIATIFKSTHDENKALDYYNNSEECYNKLINPDNELYLIQLSNDKNRGVIYRNNISYDTAEFYLNRSLENSKAIHDSSWIARNYNSLAILYKNQNDYKRAEEAFKESLFLKRSQNYVDGEVTTLTNLADLMAQNGDYQSAKSYLSEAKELIDQVVPKRKILFHDVASVIYAATNDYKTAYEHLLASVEIRQEVNVEERSKVASELEAKYQNEANKILKTKLEAELESEKIQKEQKEKQIRMQKMFLILGVLIGIVLIVLLWFVYRANVKRKAANLELQQKNDEITAQNNKIELQRSQIQEKNTEILDSITYAKRIQQAILPSDDLVKSVLGDSFVYYKPKDIVSGDFYFVEETESHYFWAAADCTGHGVPGAMVSVVCHNALSRSVHEFGLIDPGDILGKTRELVIDTFKKSAHEVKDGMDIALLVRKKGERKISFAGANNPVWIVSDVKDGLEEDEFDFKEIKGDKQPVGVHLAQKPFTSHEILLSDHQFVYIFTDGFADQFGGERGKKLKYKNLKSLILQSVNTGMAKQQNFLDHAFEEWKGNFEQLDDVCVMGVKL